MLQTTIDGMRNEIKGTVDKRNSLANEAREHDRRVDERGQRTGEAGEVGCEPGRPDPQAEEHARSIPRSRRTTRRRLRRRSGRRSHRACRGRDVVEISVGADDGVRKGHQFVVTRPSTGKYIGIIEVIQVDYPQPRRLPSRQVESRTIRSRRATMSKRYSKPR